MAGELQPLDEKFAIVDEFGKPTLYFIKWAQQRQIDIGEGITLLQLEEYLLAHQLQEGSGIQITPSGNLSDSPTIAADVQEILDQITITHGSVIYRNASDWVALPPGTAGYFLKTQGAGADPVWAATAGGGSGYDGGPPTPPTTSDLATWDNQGTSTVSDGNGAMILKPQVDGNMHGRYKAAPATPYDIYCRVDAQALSSASGVTNVVTFAGILLKNTAGGNERITFGVYAERIAGDEQIIYAVVVRQYTGASPPVLSSDTPPAKFGLKPWQWLRINNDGTTLTFSASMDGKNWLQMGTDTIAAFIGAVGSYGVFAMGNANSTETAGLFTYFSTTAPA